VATATYFKRQVAASMVVEGSIKEGDYVAAQFLHMRPRPLFAALGAILLCIFLLVLFFNRDIAGFVVLFALAAFPLYTLWSAKRAFRQYKALSEPQAIEVKESGLYFKRENGEALVPWSHVRKWRHNNKLLLLYPASRLFHLIPSHFFTSHESYLNFLARVEEHLGKPT
jgi:hypothetical protein